jgi:hypothetical protein
VCVCVCVCVCGCVCVSVCVCLCVCVFVCVRVERQMERQLQLWEQKGDAAFKEVQAALLCNLRDSVCRQELRQERDQADKTVKEVPRCMLWPAFEGLRADRSCAGCESTPSPPMGAAKGQQTRLHTRSAQQTQHNTHPGEGITKSC